MNSSSGRRLHNGWRYYAAGGDCGARAELHDGWQAEAPAMEGLDPKLIYAIASRLEESPHAKPNGVVVVRHGVLVYEHYFADYNAGDMQAMNSASKSVVALLVGIAFDRGWLTHISAPVFSFFLEYADLRAVIDRRARGLPLVACVAMPQCEPRSD